MAKTDKILSVNQRIGDSFIESQWSTPNTYSENFSVVPHKSGVYLFVTLDDQVLYVGSAKNLFKRYDKHEVKRLLRKLHNRIYFYFIECDNYRETEIKVIKKYKPLFNSQHNG